MSDILRVAVIGSSSTGGWGHNIDELFIKTPGLRIVAVADDTQGGLSEAITRHRLSETRNTAFLNWEKMIAEIKPDIVAICSRNI